MNPNNFKVIPNKFSYIQYLYAIWILFIISLFEKYLILKKL